MNLVACGQEGGQGGRGSVHQPTRLGNKTERASFSSTESAQQSFGAAATWEGTRAPAGPYLPPPQAVKCHREQMPRRNRRTPRDAGNRPPRPNPRPEQEHRPKGDVKAPAFSVPWKGYSASFSSSRRKPTGIRHENKDKDKDKDKDKEEEEKKKKKKKGEEKEEKHTKEEEAEEDEEERRVAIDSTTPTPSREDPVAQPTSKTAVIPVSNPDKTQRRGPVLQEDNASLLARNAGSLVPGKHSLSVPQHQISVAPRDEGRAQQRQQAEEGEEAQQIRIGYNLAGAYVEMTATPPSYHPNLPPLYHMLEVAHRQQRRELEEAFAVRTVLMEQKQESLRSQGFGLYLVPLPVDAAWRITPRKAWVPEAREYLQDERQLRMLEATDPKMKNVNDDNQEQNSKQIGYGEASNGVALGPEKGSNGGDKRRAKNANGENRVVDRALCSSAEAVRDTTKGSSDAKDENKELCHDSNHATKVTHVHDETRGGTGRRSSDTVKPTHIDVKTSTSTTSTTSKACPGSIAAATARIKAEREEIRALLKGLVESGDNLSRVRKEVAGKTKRFSEPQESRAITKAVGSPGHREFPENGALSRVGTTDGLAKEKSTLPNPERELAAERQSGNAPSRENRRSGGVCGADSLGGGDGGGDNDEIFPVGVVETLRERAAAASLAAEVARKDGDRARVELEAFKDRVAAVEELL
ncbi:unnamed protein product, partial [Ectocarpus fasciculatus]